MENEKYPKEETIQFSMGKSFGLAGDSAPLDDYKIQMQAMELEFRTTLNELATKVKDQFTSILETVPKIKNESTADNTQYLNGAEELLKKLAGLYTPEVKENALLLKTADELSTAAVARFKTNNEKALASEEKLKTEIENIGTTLSTIREDIGKEITTLMTALKCLDINYTELNGGFLFGRSLSVAFS